MSKVYERASGSTHRRLTGIAEVYLQAVSRWLLYKLRRGVCYLLFHEVSTDTFFFPYPTYLVVRRDIFFQYIFSSALYDSVGFGCLSSRSKLKVCTSIMDILLSVDEHWFKIHFGCVFSLYMLGKSIEIIPRIIRSFLVIHTLKSGPRL